MSKIKRLAGETVLYGLGSILPRFLNFLLVRLHTGVFAPDAYGVITKLFAYSAVINIIFMFGMETAYFRFANKEGVDEKKIFNIAQTIVISISAALTLIFIVFAAPIADMLSIPGKSDYVIWLAFILFIDSLVAIPFARLRLQKRAIKFVIGKLANILILVGLNIYFLYIAFDPARGVGFVVLANLIANAFYLVFFSRTLLQWRPEFDRSMFRTMIQYSYPIMLMGLAGMTNEMFSRLTLEWWLPKNFYPGQSSEYALGIFGACYKFAILMNLAIQAFRYAAEPFFFSNASDKNSPQLFARVNHYFIIVCCLLLLTVSINLDILKHFLKRPEYWEGLNIVPVLLLGYLFLGVYYNLSAWFKLTDKTYYGTLITITGAVITIAANYILIPIAGYMGSSWATFICYFWMMAMCYILGQKFYPIPYKVISGLAYIFITIAIVYLVKSITIENQWIATSFHAFVIVLYIIIIFLVERKSFRQALR
ncbi:lipopolysaccharide biosynthesis protein [Ohtaekwangia koreensis]|uniref:Membrane protein involved in the export of O-antigen and teichoic acid n=1 Tax=Ohtaekwangia koreensis TaxID=688867 RepID=A0A1T5IL47_9BACT|nr:polysaccharide biosynthesis C-terminal domain-containing protein [Ohtaekwangia koreensis]SKC39703.1 Membrane protein involved in the export of O-antigen and teichoic acid [Ohtaekwangia koreensis]